MPDALTLDRVTAGYGDTPAVREVSLAVADGEVVGLIGPNGSGKTTVVRAVSRTLRPTSGRIALHGTDPYGVPARAAARLVAVVPQEIAPTFAYTVLEVILMGRTPYVSAWGGGGAEDYRLAREAAELARVQHLSERTLDELSGGERQRVVLAQALAQDAPVLVLDEPTTHLDARHVVEILDTVRRLAREDGKGVLAIFHDLNLAAAYCDRLITLSEGRVVSEGSPGSVVTPALLSEVYGVAGDVIPNPLTGRPTVLLGPPLGRADGRGLPRAHVVGGAGRGAPVMRLLAEAGYEVTAGVLHDGDTDAWVAERLNLERLTIPPFSVVDQTTEREAISLMRAADLIVVCDAPYGPGNIANLRAALTACESGTRTLVLESTPMSERDFTGGEAATLWERLATRATTAATYEELLAAARS